MSDEEVREWDMRINRHPARRARIGGDRDYVEATYIGGDANHDEYESLSLGGRCGYTSVDSARRAARRLLALCAWIDTQRTEEAA